MRSLVAVLAVWSLLAQPAEAQATADRGRRLTLLVGPMLMTERDENASPLRYGGPAALFEIGYATRTDHRAIALRSGIAVGTLRSELTQPNDRPRQETLRDWIQGEYVRSLSAANSRTRWLAGALLAGHRTVIRHRYARGGSARYAFYSAALGPVVTVERALGEQTTLIARLGAPVIAFVGRPYGALRGSFYLIPPHLPLRVATVPRYQAVDFTVAYTTNVRHRAAIVIGHHLDVQRYHDGQPFRFASQSVSFAVALRLGGDQ